MKPGAMARKTAVTALVIQFYAGYSGGWALVTADTSRPDCAFGAKARRIARAASG